jgi:hypothetical protein
MAENGGDCVGLAGYAGSMHPQQGGDTRFMQTWAAHPEQRRPRFSLLALCALVVAAAALAVGIAALVRPTPAPPPAAPAASSSAHPAATTEANRAFCTAIAPLMAESDKSAKAYSRLGKPNSPEWKPGAQVFITDTKAWLPRMQSIIDTHGDASPFVLRSMQRFADDLQYLIEDLESGPWEEYDHTIWDDSLSAGSGPANVCFDLGVKW